MIQEVIQVGVVTRVHHAPDYIKGVINLRGKIVTIIDLTENWTCRRATNARTTGYL